jgi:hypothetical protein
MRFPFAEHVLFSWEVFPLLVVPSGYCAQDFCLLNACCFSWEQFPLCSCELLCVGKCWSVCVNKCTGVLAVLVAFRDHISASYVPIQSDHKVMAHTGSCLIENGQQNGQECSTKKNSVSKALM